MQRNWKCERTEHGGHWLREKSSGMKANKSAQLIHEYSYEVICQFAD